MPLYRDEAVVLRTHKLGEADRIVTMLSRNHGKIRAVAKGVRRTASKFGSRLEPFMVADVQCYEGRSLDIITQAESLGSYGAVIADDYASYTAASVMVETADKLTEDDGGLQQYLLLVGALRSLARHEHGPSSTLDSYLLRALSVAGWAPSFSDCAMTGAPGPHSAFVVQLGGVVADEVAPPGAPRLDATTIGLLSALLTGDWAVADAAGDRTRSQASGVVAAYTQFHLERGLRSLEHVDRRREAELGAETERGAGADSDSIGRDHPAASSPDRPRGNSGAATTETSAALDTGARYVATPEFPDRPLLESRSPTGVPDIEYAGRSDTNAGRSDTNAGRGGTNARAVGESIGSAGVVRGSTGSAGAVRGSTGSAGAVGEDAGSATSADSRVG